MASRKPGDSFAARLGRTRLPLLPALAGLAVLIALGAALGLVFASRAGQPPASATDASTGELSTPVAEPLAVPTAGPAGEVAASDVTPTLVVAVPAPFPTGLPTPASRAGSAAFGPFELGGQVEHDIRHPDMMRQAGMAWVKFDLAWQPGQDPGRAWRFIEQAHRLGFKVLLSVRAGTQRPDEIDTAAYLDFLTGLAYYEPDAIEVWSEPNTYLHWPQGQVDGGTYVRSLLVPAYNAIKSANNSVIVISGAPLPGDPYAAEGGCSQSGYGCDETVFLEQMADAGARNYLDCAGVRFVEGTEPPSQGELAATIDRYARAFNRPVCFVALGYLSPEGYGSPPEGYEWAANVTAADQAAWLAEAAQLAAADPRVRLMVVWNVDYLTWVGEEPGAGYAMLRPDGTCPACDALGRVTSSP